MRDAEGVPEDYVGVFDVGAGVFEPFWDAAGGGAGGLGDVAPGGGGLVVGVWRGRELVWIFSFCGGRDGVKWYLH